MKEILVPGAFLGLKNIRGYVENMWGLLCSSGTRVDLVFWAGKGLEKDHRVAYRDRTSDVTSSEPFAVVGSGEEGEGAVGHP